MERSDFSFAQYHGNKYGKPLSKWKITLWLGLVLCLVIGLAAGLQGKEAWVTSGALWEIAVILLGWTFFADLAKIIGELARAKDIVFHIRGAAWKQLVQTYDQVHRE